MKYVSYYRVSTMKQGANGLGIEGQMNAVQAFIATKEGAVIVASFTEVESGKNDNRPQLIEALRLCKENGYTLLIAKLDRLSRNVEFLFHVKNSGVSIACCDLPELNTLTLGIYATLAQHERELISQRTKVALQAKKAKGIKLGAPNARFTDEMRDKAKQILTEKAESNENTIRAIEAIKAQLSITSNLSHIAKYLNDHHFTTPKGKSFSAVQVKRIIEKHLATNKQG